MEIGVLLSLIAAIVSMLAGGVASSGVIQESIRRLLGQKEPEKSYSERLADLRV